MKGFMNKDSGNGEISFIGAKGKYLFRENTNIWSIM